MILEKKFKKKKKNQTRSIRTSPAQKLKNFTQPNTIQGKLQLQPN